MRFLIYGTGGLGGYFGALLQKANHEVHFIARGQSLEVMQQQGLQVQSFHGNFDLPEVSASSGIPSDKSFDYILICTKSWSVEEAAQAIKPFTDSQTSVLFLQNGIDNYEKVIKHIDPALVLPATAKVVSALVQPGVIEQKSGVRQITFGELSGEVTERCKKLEEALVSANIEAVLSDNIEGEIWKKFVFISAFSGITALTRSPIGPILKDPEGLKMYTKCLQETFALAQAKKIKLPDNLVSMLLDFSKGLEDNLTSSLQEDIQRGRRSELETLTGEVVRRSADHSLSAPVNKFIYTVLKIGESSKTK